jgi:biopolymer transport protein ExbD
VTILLKKSAGGQSAGMRGGRQRKPPDMDMAPLIDCVFLLLIFFMVATTFAPLPGLRVKLPPPGKPSTDKPKGLMMRIVNPEGGKPDGVMVLNDEIVGMDEVLGKFLNAPVQMREMLVIQSERQVRHEQIVQIMDFAKRAGIDSIGFAMVARGP